VQDSSYPQGFRPFQATGKLRSSTIRHFWEISGFHMSANDAAPQVSPGNEAFDPGLPDGSGDPPELRDIPPLKEGHKREIAPTPAMTLFI